MDAMTAKEWQSRMNGMRRDESRSHGPSIKLSPWTTVTNDSLIENGMSRSHSNLLHAPNSSRGTLGPTLEFNPPAHLLRHVLTVQYSLIIAPVVVCSSTLDHACGAGFKKEGHAVAFFPRRSPDAVPGCLEFATGDFAHEITDVDDDGSGYVGCRDPFAVDVRDF